MAATVDLAGVQELLGRGAQLVEVLPREEYEELHLPGAVNLPLKELDAEHMQQLYRERPVIVYCWDALCDMSPRAAARLAQLDLEVYDYALSKIDWMAHGLPVEAPPLCGRPRSPSCAAISRPAGSMSAPGRSRSASPPVITGSRSSSQSALCSAASAAQASRRSRVMRALMS